MIQSRFYMGEPKHGSLTCAESVKKLLHSYKGAAMKISSTFTIVNYDYLADKVEYIKFIAEGDEEYAQLKEIFSDVTLVESPNFYQSISNPLI